LKKNIKPLWIYPHHSPQWCQSIEREFNVHPVIAQILASREFTSLEEIYSYLYAKLPNLINPDRLLDMDRAVHRIVQAVERKETMIVYGDNDVDGITGTTLLIEFLRMIGGHALYYIPNRLTSSSKTIIDALGYALDRRCKLFITVDCGITAADEIEKYVQHQIEVIVSDHHEPTAKIPHCVATLNPKLIDSTYPNRDLTGVGVAFKLAHALTNYLVSIGRYQANQIDLKQFLDLVALGTVADMGALIGENRILVKYGLRQFAQTKRIGLLKLMDVCDIKANAITTPDIASKIAPRLNSLGRIADSQKGVQLLLIRDLKTATALAQELDDNNRKRQKIERYDSEDVEHLLISHPQILENKALVLHSHKWHPGIISITAARICKQYHRPTLVIAMNQGVGKGSIRTISEFPLLPILRGRRDLLVNFGGHDYAAGFLIEEVNIPEFKHYFIQQANEKLTQENIQPKLHLDAPVQFDDLTFDLLDSLQLLEPYGIANPPPILYADVVQARPPKIVGKMHLKLYLGQNERILEGIGFGLSNALTGLRKKNLSLKVAFTPHVNIFLGQPSIQLLIKDFFIKP